MYTRIIALAALLLLTAVPVDAQLAYSGRYRTSSDSITLHNRLSHLVRPSAAEAESLYRMARRGITGGDHPDLLATGRMLGDAWVDDLRFERALLYYRRSLRIAERMHGGNDHAVVADVLDDVAYTAYHCNDNQQSEAHYRRALEMRRRLYHNGDHPHIARSLWLLAWVYEDLGVYDTAEALLDESVAMWRRLPADGHAVGTARSLHSLARLYHHTGRMLQAGELFIAADSLLRMAAAGDDEPEYADLLRDRAFFDEDAGRPGIASRELARAMALYRRLADRTRNPVMVHGLVLAATRSANRGQSDRALMLYDEARRLLKIIYPDSDHPYGAYVLGEMAGLRQNRGDAPSAADIDESIAMYRRLVDDAGDDVSRLRAMVNLGRTLHNLERYDPAREVWGQALDLARSMYPDRDHAWVAEALDGLGRAQYQLELYPDAERSLGAAAAIERRLAGDRADPELASTLADLGLVYWAQQRYNRAIETLEQSVALYRRIHPGGDDASLAVTLCNLARLHARTGRDPVQVEALFDEAVRVGRRAWRDPDHPMLRRLLGYAGRLDD